MKETVITIRIEPGMKADLEKLAKKDDRNLSDYVRVQLKKIVEESKKRK